MLPESGWHSGHLFSERSANTDSVVPVMVYFRFCASACPSGVVQPWLWLECHRSSVNHGQLFPHSFLFLSFPSTSTSPTITFWPKYVGGRRGSQIPLGIMFFFFLVFIKVVTIHLFVWLLEYLAPTSDYRFHKSSKYVCAWSLLYTWYLAQCQVHCRNSINTC